MGKVLGNLNNRYEMSCSAYSKDKRCVLCTFMLHTFLGNKTLLCCILFRATRSLSSVFMSNCTAGYNILVYLYSTFLSLFAELPQLFCPTVLVSIMVITTSVISVACAGIIDTFSERPPPAVSTQFLLGCSSFCSCDLYTVSMLSLRVYCGAPGKV